MELKAKHTVHIKISGKPKRILPGETFDAPDATAEELIAKGAAVPVEGAAKKPASKKAPAKKAPAKKAAEKAVDPTAVTGASGEAGEGGEGGEGDDGLLS